MDAMVAFLLGAVVVVGVVAWRDRRRRLAVLLASRTVLSRERRSPRGVRASSLTVLRDETERLRQPEVREHDLSEDLCGYLGDVTVQHRAADALLWIRRSEGEAFAPVAWNHDGAPPDASWGTEKQRALIGWAASEGVVTFDDDGDGRPTLAAVRVPLQAVGEFTEHEHAVGALVLHSHDGIGGERGELRLWLPRHADRLAQLVELQVTRNEVARQNRRFRVLMRNARDVREAPAPGEQQALERRIADSAVEATGASYAALVRWNPELRRGVIRHTTTLYPAPVPAAEDTVDADSLVGGVCIGGTQLVWDDAAMPSGDEPLYSSRLASVNTGAVAILPLARGSACIGAIVIGAREAGAFRPNDLRTAKLLSQLAASALEAEWEIEEVSRRSRTDQLTGLGNRRHFDAELLRVLNETDRFGHGCALILADVDHFKQVNDTHGHEAGDLALRAIAAVLRDLVRTTDIVARVGGEEFCVILPQTGVEGATELAERLRVSIEDTSVPWKDGRIAVSASFGVATYEAGSGLGSLLFEAADRALYAAKREGRNRVRTSD